MLIEIFKMKANISPFPIHHEPCVLLPTPCQDIDRNNLVQITVVISAAVSSGVSQHHHAWIPVFHTTSPALPLTFTFFPPLLPRNPPRGMGVPHIVKPLSVS